MVKIEKFLQNYLDRKIDLLDRNGLSLIINNIKSGLGKNPGNLKKSMGMGKTGFYREKWEKREKLPFFKIHILKACQKIME
jgi:hypothetical protein